MYQIGDKRWQDKVDKDIGLQSYVIILPHFFPPMVAFTSLFIYVVETLQRSWEDRWDHFTLHGYDIRPPTHSFHSLELEPWSKTTQENSAF